MNKRPDGFTPPAAGGFTLVECAIALAVLALALGTLLPATLEALGRQSGAAQEGAALAAAEALLARAGRDIPLAPGSLEGRDGTLDWRLEIAPAAAPEGPWVTTWAVTATVAGSGWARRRPVRLATLRLAPTP
jgi:prepilin-type N-terminal cleavage/methylation domain-containing protein